jgi:hypothetical protein
MVAAGPVPGTPQRPDTFRVLAAHVRPDGGQRAPTCSTAAPSQRHTEARSDGRAVTLA